MKTDIQTRKDIEKLVPLFYQKIMADPELHTFFSDMDPVRWNRHLQTMGDFWENILFYTGDYGGDPLKSHIKINKSRPTTPRHFERWLRLFSETVDELFAGSNASKIKNHAKGIAAIMQQKIANK